MIERRVITTFRRKNIQNDEASCRVRSASFRTARHFGRMTSRFLQPKRVMSGRRGVMNNGGSFVRADARIFTRAGDHELSVPKNSERRGVLNDREPAVQNGAPFCTTATNHS